MIAGSTEESTNSKEKLLKLFKKLQETMKYTTNKTQ